ncbi:MAG: glycoside hydrolase family 3 N-terminal domain-containing protein [Bacteroidota bacterium]
MFELPSTKTLRIKQKIGQLFMPAAFINDNEEEIQKMEQLINDHHIGSICFFHSRASAATNFEGKKEVVHNENSYERLRYLIERYQKAATVPLLIAIDAEWGLAMRIENTPQYPYAITLGAMQHQEDLVFQVGRGIAQDCRKAGIHWNLSPVVDINLDPDNPVIGYRSFGDDRNRVTQYAKAYLHGMRSEGILNSIKHFPGHGDTATDSHLGLPLIDKTKSHLLENELYPFVQLMDDTLDAVMVGHLAVPALSNGKKISSSVSKEVMTGFLRDELDWNGVIISDALNMHAVSKDFPDKGGVEYAAFEAGNDILCFADNVAEGLQTISENCSTTRIEESFHRFWKLKEKALNNTTLVSEKIPFENLMEQLAETSLTFLKGDSPELHIFRRQGFDFVPFGKTDGLFYDQFNAHKSNNGNVLVSIVPRQVKPKNRFGFTEEELQKICELLETKEVAIYLFGNPFVLNLMPWQKAGTVVVVYQDFAIFQQHAINHFKGRVEAKGKLPVTLKNILS